MGVTIAAFLPIALELLKEAPAAIEVGGEIVDGVKKIWNGIAAVNPPTAAEQASYDDALRAAHAALQAS
jgi:hypothetical protein